MVGWLFFGFFYGVSTLFWLFNAESSHFDKFQTIQFRKIFLVYTQLNIKTIQFSISTQFSSIWPIDRTISGATTPGQSKPGSDSNERVIRIPQSSSITGTSPSDCLVSYLGYSLVGGGLTPLQRSSRCILPPQPTGLICTENSYLKL